MCNPSSTLNETKSKLSTNGELGSYPTLYHNLLGAIKYLTFTHHDIVYVIDAGPSVEDRALAFLKPHDRVTKGDSRKWP